MLLQALNILETFDLQAMGYASADYLHTVVEAMKLAYADRDTYYADQAFVATPAEGLLSKEYARERAALIDPLHASTAYVAGDPLPYDSNVDRWDYWKADLLNASIDQIAAEPSPQALLASLGKDSTGAMKDTTHIAIVDEDGNMFDATPSGGVDWRRRDPWRYRHWHERPWRAVLAGQHASESASPARTAPLHADTEHGVQGRCAYDGPGGRRGATIRNRRSSRCFSASSSSGTTGIPISTRRSSGRAPRPCTSSARSGRTRLIFNRLNIEATISDAVYEELRAPRTRGRPTAPVRNVGMRDGRHDRSVDPESPGRR